MPSTSTSRSDIQWPRHPTFGFPLKPIWPSEPSLVHLEALARRHLSIAADEPCTIAHFAEGGFNKLYSITIGEREDATPYLIRVVLPVEPRFKTLSEVATITFVRAHATELVPRVLAYSADAESDALGYEWMIMERMPGGVLEEHWGTMEWDAKVELVKTLAGALAKIYDVSLRGIGNIYPDDPSPNAHISLAPSTGRIISTAFFWGDRYEQDVPRGPFQNSHDWLHSCLQFVLNDAANVLARPVTEDESDYEREEAQLTHALAERLVKLLPRVFPPAEEAEATVIHHQDLSFQNLLANASGKLVGIVDWECVSALPFWRACTLPTFLEGRTRMKQPDIGTYRREGDGEVSNLYAEHLLEWERTQLRTVFLDEMGRLRPEWVRMHRDPASLLKNDFFYAIEMCDEELYQKMLGQWLGRLEAMSAEEIRAPGIHYERLHVDYGAVDSE